MKQVHFFFKILLIITSIFFLLTCSSIKVMTLSPSYWPTKEWKKDTPESQGISSTDLSTFLDVIKSNRLPVHSMMLIRNGYQVFEGNFYPYDGTTVHDVASVTKSVMSLLIGIAIRQHFIKNENEPIANYLKQYSELFDKNDKSKITIRHLLTMTSGLQSAPKDNQSMPEALILETMQEKDWGRHILSLPLQYLPGTHFSYNSAHYHLLSIILHESSGMEPDELVKKYLFMPLGIGDFIWPKDPQGNLHGWGDLMLYPKDMAKIGFLCLHNGIWNGQRILPEGWIYSSFSPHINYATRTDSYGYGWWIPNGKIKGVFEANGRGGQHILIMPAKNLILIFTGGGFDMGQIAGSMLCIKLHDSPILNDDKSTAILNKIMQSMEMDQTEKNISALPKTAFDVSGKTWEFAANIFGLKNMTLFFLSNGEAYMQIGNDQRNKLRIGLDDVYAFNFSGRNGLPVALKGKWEHDDSFILEMNEIANINDFFLYCSFHGEKSRFSISDKTLTGGALIDLPLK